MVSLLTFICNIFAVTIFAALICLVLAIVDICKLNKSSEHSWIKLLHHYASIIVLHFIGYIQFEKLEKDTANCHQVQKEFLMNVIAKNSKTEYGRNYNFVNIKTKEDFISFHPLTRYNHYEEYIDRTARGQPNILVPAKPDILAVTSGTTGRCKLIPFTKDVFLQFFFWGISTFSYCMVKAYPNVRNLLRVVKFFYAPQVRVSGGGIRIGPNSSNPANSRHNLPFYTTPSPAYEIPSESDVLYLHLLFALKDRTLGAMEANFAALIYYAFYAMCQQWEALVEDIRLGRINPELEISHTVRSKLQRYLKPNPKRADELRREFSAGFRGIAKRIWPEMQIILSVNTGSMAVYYEYLRSYYTEGIIHYSPLYAATEGLLGVNIWPKELPAVYLLIPKSMFYEFIPIASSDEENPPTVCTDEVQEGETYELVITNTCGLYRYRIGDVIKIVGFYHQTPVVEFLYRHGQLLNVRGEKLPENIFFETLQQCIYLWENIILHDYCCSESVNYPSLPGSSPMVSAPHYLVFLETEGPLLIESQCTQFDDILQDNHFVYRSYRKKGSIAALRVLQVSSGTFQALRTHILNTTEASSTQVKIPRVISDSDHLRFLMRRIINDPCRPSISSEDDLF